ncbi:ABC transporter permease subunit [Paenibacillus sp. D51F]
MSIALYRHMMKSHGKGMLNYAIGAAFYMLLMFWLFPSFANSSKAVEGMIDSLPKGMAEALNLSAGFGTVEAFVSGEFYGLLLVLILSVYSVSFSTRLMARLVDRGSMAYLLSVPVTRARAAATQAAVFVTGLLAIMTVATLSGFAGYVLFIGNLSSFGGAAFARMNLAAFLLFFAAGGICFLISSSANDEKRAAGLSAVLTFGMYSFDFLGKLSSQIEWLRKLTYFSLYDPSGVIAGRGNPGLAWPILAVIGAVAFAAAIWLFHRRDLPL